MSTYTPTEFVESHKDYSDQRSEFEPATICATLFENRPKFFYSCLNSVGRRKFEKSMEKTLVIHYATELQTLIRTKSEIRRLDMIIFSSYTKVGDELGKFKLITYAKTFRRFHAEMVRFALQTIEVVKGEIWENSVLRRSRFLEIFSKERRRIMGKYLEEAREEAEYLGNSSVLLWGFSEEEEEIITIGCLYRWIVLGPKALYCFSRSGKFYYNNFINLDKVLESL